VTQLRKSWTVLAVLLITRSVCPIALPRSVPIASASRAFDGVVRFAPACLLEVPIYRDCARNAASFGGDDRALLFDLPFIAGKFPIHLFGLLFHLSPDLHGSLLNEARLLFL
jgi:hypothetical protein